MHQDFEDAKTLALLGTRGEFTFELRAGECNLWVVARRHGVDLMALRSGLGGGITLPPAVTEKDGSSVCEWATKIGALRLKVAMPGDALFTIRCTFSLLPVNDVRLSSPARDLYFLDHCIGVRHTTQRGLRTGAFFASCTEPARFSVLYVQDFSSLNAFFDITQCSPADTVGGDLVEAGYAVPQSDRPLPKSLEVIVSDAYIALAADALETEGQIGGGYLDLLADVYAGMDRPMPVYHDWTARAAQTLRALTLSPECTYERGNGRFLMPYVGDRSKPPESMVQLTSLLNTLEYDAWRGAQSAYSRILHDGFERFFNPDIGCVVRWLPGEDFGEQQEEHMDHETMDSWYLYHALFNVSRLASLGDAKAREILEKSLPFAIRVARRFDYLWPIFFNLKTLDIVRAESEPGKGGEHDVAGLYALVMLHAHELFGDEPYLAEAKRAAAFLHGLKFGIGYQMNTTGFAAEAALRLWKLTGDRHFLDLSEMCLANMFDNMWIWDCNYGKALHYRTFFGLFPLHDAPYLAAYEELEAQAKFNDYVALAGPDIRPSLRLLLAEYQKYGLDRGWYYYPEALPDDGIAEKVRNGKIERALAIPLEDLQDGMKPSGEVGQELYGAGLAFVYTSRHYTRLPEVNTLVYCQYPIYKMKSLKRKGAGVLTFDTGGDSKMCCELRLISIDVDRQLPCAHVYDAIESPHRAVERHTSVEGDGIYTLRGNRSYEIHFPEAPTKSRKS